MQGRVKVELYSVSRGACQSLLSYTMLILTYTRLYNVIQGYAEVQLSL